MKITKYGHACVLVEEKGASILVDPGRWSTVPKLSQLDAILITHEHGDHVDLETVGALLERHPQAVVYTNEQVGKMLREKGLSYTRLEDGDTAEVQGILIEGVGREHAIIYGTTSPCVNTGYLINEDLFIPGDALSAVPASKVRLLALPTSGPWMKLSEAIDYAKKLAPSIVFPVHDALYTEEVRRGLVPRVIGSHLEAVGITFRDLKDGESISV